MITEKQVKDYLKFKDKDYINALIDSLHEDDEYNAASSYEPFPICGFLSFQKERKRQEWSSEIYLS